MRGPPWRANAGPATRPASTRESILKTAERRFCRDVYRAVGADRIIAEADRLGSQGSAGLPRWTPRFDLQVAWRPGGDIGEPEATPRFLPVPPAGIEPATRGLGNRFGTIG